MKINKIHHTAIIDSRVNIGNNVFIGPHTVIRGNVTICDNSYIASHVSIGEVAEHSSDKYELCEEYSIAKKQIIIGSGVVIREFTTINQPMKDRTVISDNCYLMARTHISHDNFLEAGVILSTNTCLGGWTRVMKHANVGLGVITHQFTTIGPYVMVAAGAVVVKDIPPFCKFIPGKEPGINTYAIKKHNLPQVETPEYGELLRSLTDDWENHRHKERKTIKW